ncbi:unnamed protein product, partial [Ectocarpus sp. 13 AM-2016]
GNLRQVEHDQSGFSRGHTLAFLFVGESVCLATAAAAAVAAEHTAAAAENQKHVTPGSFFGGDACFPTSSSA